VLTESDGLLKLKRGKGNRLGTGSMAEEERMRRRHQFSYKEAAQDGAAVRPSVDGGDSSVGRETMEESAEWATKAKLAGHQMGQFRKINQKKEKRKLVGWLRLMGPNQRWVAENFF
jgi:hypothetical protein